MCGIFGVVYRDGLRTPSEDRLQASARLLTHRGPDAQGVYSQPGAGLAHTRLSLLDLNERSNQPFWDATQRHVIVFNGEIYNFQDLRRELEEGGHTFRTSSDTEVLLEAVIAWGVDLVLPRLDGMFAFAILDSVTGHITLGRDRFGTKPLYVYEGDEFIAFASEVKAFTPWTTLAPEPYPIGAYLMGFGGPMRGRTFYRNVRIVATGAIVDIGRGGQMTERIFFSIADFYDAGLAEELGRLSPRQTADRFDAAINASVGRQMFADARVGAFCSGGVDSSLLLAVAARKHRNLAIFHANIKGRWSETGAARRLADALKLSLNVVEVEEQEFVDQIPAVMQHYEHPFTYHPNCAPFMLVSRLARAAGVKGLLSGEGSDECFLGYPWLGRERITNAYYRMGNKIRRLVRSVPQVGRILWPWDEERGETIKAVFSGFEAEHDIRAARTAAAAQPVAIPEGNVRSVEYLGYHLRTLLHRNDTLGMAASIESRFPFLDLDVVRAAVNTPYEYKIRYSPFVLEKAHPFVRDKWVVREVASRYLPPDLSQRIKIGFWTTVFERLQVAPSYFSNSLSRELLGLSTRDMAMLLDRADRDLVVRLLHLDIWARVCLRREPVEACVPSLRDHVTIIPE